MTEVPGESPEATRDASGDFVESGLGRQRPPIRRGSRDQRREETLQTLITGRDALCAYCGQQLPPMPARGGRPTPYCPADPERYGQWGAKVITCAMLDEHREIWVQIYGPDQPMTRLDVGVLDDRLTHIKTAVAPLLNELSAIQSYVSSQVTAAVVDRGDAQAARQRAERATAAAHSERDDAQADARAARAAAEADRAERDEANARATEAETAAAQAVTARQAAETVRDDAQRERQQALQQVADMQQRVTDLQTTLQQERTSAVDTLARLRAEHTETEARLRTTLLADYEQKLTEQIQHFEVKETRIREAAEDRVGTLTRQLAQAAQDYAQALAPLHTEKATLAQRLAEHTTLAEQTQRRLDTIKTGLTDLVEQLPRDNALRAQLKRILDTASPVAGNGA